MKARQIKWIAAAIAMIFLLAGTSWADGKRNGRPGGNGGHQAAQQHRPDHGGNGGHQMAQHHRPNHGGYHQAPGHGHHNPQPHHGHHKPVLRPYKPHHHPNHGHHHYPPHYAHNRKPHHSHYPSTTIRVNPDRVFLSALFANPFLLFDVHIND